MNIRIEKLQKSDAELLFKFEKENKLFFEKFVPSRGEHYYEFSHFQTVLDDLLKEQFVGKSFFYLIKEDETICGRINLVDIDPLKKSGKIGYRVGAAFIKKGVATNALNLLLEETKKLDIHELYAMTTHNNIGSQKVLGNCGFIRYLVDGKVDTEFVHYVWKR